MPKYVLACPDCGQPIEIAVTQAGQELSCTACGHSTTAPRLGELKRLSVVEDSGTQKPSKSRSNSGLFVAGLLLALIGLGGGAGLFAYGQSKISDFDLEKSIEQQNQEIDEFKDHLVVLYYDSLPIDKGLGEWREQPHISSTRQGKILTGISYGLMGLGVVGLVLMILGLRRR